MTINTFLEKLKKTPESIDFKETMAVIADNYIYSPAEFMNGELRNQAGTNEGSCKIFAFGQLNQLSDAETLACFGDYYRKDVLENPTASDHGNIRNFMETGWSGIEFKSPALVAKGE